MKKGLYEQDKKKKTFNDSKLDLKFFLPDFCYTPRMQASQPSQGDIGLGMNRRPSFSESSSVEIPEFLRKKGRSRYPRA